MSTKQYYICSPWDNKLIPISDELKSFITISTLTLIKKEEKASYYQLNQVGNEYNIIYCTPEYAGFLNRITDFSFRVEVIINGQYVPAKNHQEQALIKYVITKEPIIEVPHPNGGMFRVTFSQLDEHHFQYTTEDDFVVQMRRIPII